MIAVYQLLSNSALYDHRGLENIKMYTNLLSNVMINRITSQLLKPPWYPLLRYLTTTVQ